MLRRGATSGAAAAIVLAAPALASACPSWGKVKGFTGKAGDILFEESVSGSDGNGGTETVDLDRNATNLKIELPARVPKTGSRFTEFLGGVEGGLIFVADTYTDTISGSETTGAESAHAPDDDSIPFGSVSSLVLDPAGCTYQLGVSFAVPTTSNGSWPTPPDAGAGGFALSPKKRIPASLKLSGNVSVPAYYDGCAGESPAGGWYEFAGIPGGGYSWVQEFDTLKSCGSSQPSPTGCPDGEQEGTAEFSWSLTPAIRKPANKKHHK